MSFKGSFRNLAMIKINIPAIINLIDERNNGETSVTAILFNK